MLEIVHSLTSAPKKAIFHLLARPMTPEEIARSLSVTRQGVDKHLKELLKYGLVRKMWLLSPGRPRVQYEATEMGELFFSRLDSFMTEYRKIGRENIIEELKELDIKFIRGTIDKQSYLSEQNKIKSEYDWFYTSEDGS